MTDALNAVGEDTDSSETEPKCCEDSKQGNAGNLLSVSLLSIPVVLFAVYLGFFIRSSYQPSTQITFKSYKEACLSGQFTSLKDLHQYVDKEVTTYQGEMDKDEFLDNYFWKSKIVLMKGAAKDWPAFKELTDDYLLDNLYDSKFYVDLVKNYFTGHTVRTLMPLGKYLRNYKQKDWYLDSMTQDERFHDTMKIPKYLNISGIFTKDENNIVEYDHNLYLSSGNTDSPLHYDGYSNLLTVLDGVKEWILAEPADADKLRFDDHIESPNVSPMNVTDFSVSEFPELCNVTWYRAVLHPGDTLFVPDLHPHHVYSVPGRNLAVGMWFMVQHYADKYTELVESAKGEDGEVPTLKRVEIHESYVRDRPHPCEVTDCSPLPSNASNLRALLHGNVPNYSRDSDQPAPAVYTMNLANQGKKRNIPGICYGTGLPRASLDNSYLNTLTAINMGYKCVDTAVMYGNEAEIGRAVRDSKWAQKSVIVVTKFLFEDLKGDDLYTETVTEVEGSLSRLGLEYIDILLLHDTMSVPLDKLEDVWRAMESLTKTGKVRALGLSNAEMFHIKLITEIGTVPISMVQNIFNPFEYEKDLYKYCAEHGIVFMGYGVTGDIYLYAGFKRNPLIHHKVIARIAKLYDTSRYAVLLNWAAQKGVVVIARSGKLAHMKQNLEYRDVLLNPDHVAEIDELYVEEEEEEEEKKEDAE